MFPLFRTTQKNVFHEQIMIFKTKKWKITKVRNHGMMKIMMQIILLKCVSQCCHRANTEKKQCLWVSPAGLNHRAGLLERISQHCENCSLNLWSTQILKGLCAVLKDNKPYNCFIICQWIYYFYFWKIAKSFQRLSQIHKLVFKFVPNLQTFQINVLVDTGSSNFAVAASPHPYLPFYYHTDKYVELKAYVCATCMICHPCPVLSAWYCQSTNKVYIWHPILHMIHGRKSTWCRKALAVQQSFIRLT